MNLASQSVIIIGMLAATLINDECLLSLAVVAVRHKIAARADDIGVRDPTQQLTGSDAGIGQCRPIIILRLLTTRVRIGCRERFDLSVGRIIRPCRAVSVGA